MKIMYMHIDDMWLHHLCEVLESYIMPLLTDGEYEEHCKSSKKQVPQGHVVKAVQHMIAAWCFIFATGSLPPSTKKGKQCLQQITPNCKERVDWATKKLVWPRISAVKPIDKKVFFNNIYNLQLGNYLVERRLKLKDYGIMFPSDDPKQPKHRMWWKPCVVWCKLDEGFHSMADSIPGAEVFAFKWIYDPTISTEQLNNDENNNGMQRDYAAVEPARQLLLLQASGMQ
jgi:hypothetical protein